MQFWDVVHKVQWPCFLWGLGTALGELPPYFVSRHARLVSASYSDTDCVCMFACLVWAGNVRVARTCRTC